LPAAVGIGRIAMEGLADELLDTEIRSAYLHV
jgi:hypothetical protein